MTIFSEPLTSVKHTVVKLCARNTEEEQTSYCEVGKDITSSLVIYNIIIKNGQRYHSRCYTKAKKTNNERVVEQSGQRLGKIIQIITWKSGVENENETVLFIRLLETDPSQSVMNFTHLSKL